MAIANLEIIRIGAKNQAVNSDSLYDAFYKIKNNFATINNANLYTNYVAGNGINISANSTTGTLTITNTGVTSIVAGTGISVSSSNGGITISSNIGNSAITNVSITSNTLLVVNSSNSSTANYTINLPTTGVSAGSYNTANITVDQFGRITAVSNGITSTSSIIANGTSNVSIPVINGNIALSVSGTSNVLNISGNRVVSNANVSVNGYVNASSIIADTVTVNDDIMLGNTQIGWNSVTTNSMAYYTIAQVPISSGINGAKFFVKGIDTTGGKYSLQSIIAVTDGITANYTTYGNIFIGDGTGSLSVTIGANSIQLKVIPTSNNSTVWTTQYQAI